MIFGPNSAAQEFEGQGGLFIEEADPDEAGEVDKVDDKDLDVAKGERIDPIWWYSLPTHGFSARFGFDSYLEVPTLVLKCIKMCWTLCQLDLRVPYLYT